MEWLVFFGVVAWLAWTAQLWYRLLALRRAHALAVERLERCEAQVCAAASRSLVVEEGAPRTMRAPAPPPGPVSMNFSRRVQILRLHRRGETAEQIAASTGAPAAEVELTIKLHGRGLSTAV